MVLDLDIMVKVGYQHKHNELSILLGVIAMAWLLQAICGSIAQPFTRCAERAKPLTNLAKHNTMRTMHIFRILIASPYVIYSSPIP